MFDCGRQVERILDQQSLMARFIHIFTNSYLSFGGWDEFFRKNARGERGLLEQKINLPWDGTDGDALS